MVSNIYSWVEKKMYCDEQGIKYLHGVECYLTKSLTDNDGAKVRDNYHTILIAKNYDGVMEINRLCSLASQPDHFYYKPRLTFDEFLAISDNVIKISACLASPLNKMRKGDIDVDERLLEAYDYYEIQPHINSDEQKEYNLWLVKMAKKYGKPLIAGTDTHSLNQYKAECRTILQLAKKIEFASEDKFDLTYKSYDELVDMFSKQGVLDEQTYLEAINNTNVMADSVEPFELDTSLKYPILYDTNLTQHTDSQHQHTANRYIYFQDIPEWHFPHRHNQNQQINQLVILIGCYFHSKGYDLYTANQCNSK